MEISALKIKELRERTGAGMLDCRNALMETQGDMEAAIAYLREKGIAKAAKKAGRIASEGAVFIHLDGDRSGLMLELNCETDFVAKNEEFQTLSRTLLDYFVRHAAEEGRVVDMQDRYYDKDVEVMVTNAIAKIGENIRPRRFIRFVAKEDSFIHSYLHMGGRIGVLMEVKGPREILGKPEIREMADDLAMHIAAMNPVCVSRKDFPSSLIESERAIYRAQVLEMGKPAEMAEKIVEGKLQKFIKENTLLDQMFVKNQDLAVSAHVTAVARTVGGTVEIARFARFELGEGIEKEKKDGASEMQSNATK